MYPITEGLSIARPCSARQLLSLFQML